MDSYEGNEKYRRAKKRVKAVKKFYNNLICYIGVNILLLLLNVVFNYGNWWFWYVTVFWGIGLIFHFFRTFVFKNQFFGNDWEEKKIKEYMDEE